MRSTGIETAPLNLRVFVVNILDAPRYRRGMTCDAESKKLVITRLVRVIQNNVDALPKACLPAGEAGPVGRGMTGLTFGQSLRFVT